MRKERSVFRVPLMHQYYMGLPANLWMDRHWEDKRVVFAVRVIELFLP